MLAGRVKLKHFLIVASVTAVVCTGGLIAFCSPSQDDYEYEESYEAHVTPEVETLQSDHIDELLAYRGRDIGTTKIKDIRADAKWKANVYQDAGETSVNRAKVDLDRDDKWDEKWTFDGGTVSREISPSDDEVYTETKIHLPQTNEQAVSQPPTAAPVAKPVAEIADMRPWIASVLSYQGKDLGTTKLKDVTKGQSFKVNVYQDAGEPTANRAKVDIDRDDKWDQKWTFKPGEISVQISPFDNEDYSEAKIWTEQGWAK